MGQPTIDQGGSAFPIEGGANSQLYPDPGMSLRDWFAGQAIAGLTSCPIPGPHNRPDEIVRVAWEIADRMLAARSAMSGNQ